MDYKERRSGCLVREFDLLHMLLHALYRHACICVEYGLSCRDAPLITTTQLIESGCDRHDVYKFFRRIRKVIERFGRNIEIYVYDSLKAYVELTLKRSSIRLFKGEVVSELDCEKVECTTINNVTSLFIKLIISLSKENHVVLNVPDVAAWIARVFGLKTLESILDFIHDYVERGIAEDVEPFLRVLSAFGFFIDKESLLNAALPARRCMIALRDFLRLYEGGTVT